MWKKKHRKTSGQFKYCDYLNKVSVLQIFEYFTFEKEFLPLLFDLTLNSIKLQEKEGLFQKIVILPLF